jgi:hypothetical protein
MDTSIRLVVITGVSCSKVRSKITAVVVAEITVVPKYEGIKIPKFKFLLPKISVAGIITSSVIRFSIIIGHSASSMQTTPKLWSKFNFVVPATIVLKRIVIFKIVIKKKTHERHHIRVLTLSISKI